MTTARDPEKDKRLNDYAIAQRKNAVTPWQVAILSEDDHVREIRYFSTRDEAQTFARRVNATQAAKRRIRDAWFQYHPEAK